MEIIIDTDPGVDDALALAYIHSVDLNVKALTTTYGNQLLEETTRNAGYVAHSLEEQWPIYAGAAKPSSGEDVRTAGCHGKTGLGNVVPAPSEVRRAEGISAAAFFENVAGGQDTYDLLCLGPLTNIAEAFEQSPDLVNNIGRLVIMGGAFSEGGNITPHAEFNVHNDPDAWQAVVDRAQEAKIKATVIPAEVCRKVVLTKADLDILAERELLPDLRSLVGPYMDYYLHRATHGTYEGAVLYDVLVPLYYKYPSLFVTEGVDISVTQSGEEFGKTIAAPNATSSLQLCTGVDAREAKAKFMQALSGSEVTPS